MENYYLKFEEQLKHSHRDRLLLHACCCPCSSHCLEVLEEHFEITVFFYNPNIDSEEEYEKRFRELVRFRSEAPFAKGVELVRAEYDPETFLAMARGRETEPERGSRCYDCYELRLRRTAEYAAAHGFDCFTTTLSISPYKNAAWLNEIGVRLERELMHMACSGDAGKEAVGGDAGKEVVGGDAGKEAVGGETAKTPYFLFSDFKKKNGYRRSIELSAEYGLYRQDYCGCRYSREERQRKVEEREKEIVGSQRE